MTVGNAASLLPLTITNTTDTITFKNHTFNDGDLINYSFEGQQINGLDVSKKYYVLKVDSDNFKLSDGGLKEQNENEKISNKYALCRTIYSRSRE